MTGEKTTEASLTPKFTLSLSMLVGATTPYNLLYQSNARMGNNPYILLGLCYILCMEFDPEFDQLHGIGFFSPWFSNSSVGIRVSPCSARARVSGRTLISNDFPPPSTKRCARSG